ncbi:MAG: ribosome maturation factor RimM [Spirochaetales bacterium]
MHEELSIGRIRTAHGVAGELKVESYSGESEHFERLDAVTITKGGMRKTLAVEHIRPFAGGLLVKLAGINQREEAKKLAGWEIVASRDEAAPCRKNEYYYADLIGLGVVCGGELRGVVEAVWEGGAVPFLGVRATDGNDRLIPFQEAFIVAVDLVKRQIEIADCEVLE